MLWWNSWHEVFLKRGTEFKGRISVLAEKWTRTFLRGCEGPWVTQLGCPECLHPPQQCGGYPGMPFAILSRCWDLSAWQRMAKGLIFQSLLWKTCGLSLPCRLSRPGFVFLLGKYQEHLWSQMQSSTKECKVVQTEKLELWGVFYLTEKTLCSVLLVVTGKKLLTASWKSVALAMRGISGEAVWTPFLLFWASRRRLLLFWWSPWSAMNSHNSDNNILHFFSYCYTTQNSLSEPARNNLMSLSSG